MYIGFINTDLVLYGIAKDNIDSVEKSIRKLFKLDEATSNVLIAMYNAMSPSVDEGIDTTKLMTAIQMFQKTTDYRDWTILKYKSGKDLSNKISSIAEDMVDLDNVKSSIKTLTPPSFCLNKYIGKKVDVQKTINTITTYDFDNQMVTRVIGDKKYCWFLKPGMFSDQLTLVFFVYDIDTETMLYTKSNSISKNDEFSKAILDKLKIVKEEIVETKKDTYFYKDEVYDNFKEYHMYKIPNIRYKNSFRKCIYVNKMFIIINEPCTYTVTYTGDDGDEYYDVELFSKYQIQNFVRYAHSDNNRYDDYKVNHDCAYYTLEELIEPGNHDKDIIITELPIDGSVKAPYKMRWRSTEDVDICYDEHKTVPHLTQPDLFDISVTNINISNGGSEFIEFIMYDKEKHASLLKDALMFTEIKSHVRNTHIPLINQYDNACLLIAVRDGETAGRFVEMPYNKTSGPNLPIWLDLDRGVFIMNGFDRWKDCSWYYIK